MHSIKFDVNFMNSIFSGHETDWILVYVNKLNEAIIFIAGGGNYLKKKHHILHKKSLENMLSNNDS